MTPFRRPKVQKLLPKSPKPLRPIPEFRVRLRFEPEDSRGNDILAAVFVRLSRGFVTKNLGQAFDDIRAPKLCFSETVNGTPLPTASSCDSG